MFGVPEPSSPHELQQSRKRSSLQGQLRCQVEEMQRFFSQGSPDEILQKASVQLVCDLRALADDIEGSLTMMQCAVCPAGHTLVEKTVTGSWFSSKHCSCCSKDLEQGVTRFSCKQCHFHLCQDCLDKEDEESKTLVERRIKRNKSCPIGLHAAVAIAEIARYNQPRRSSNLSDDPVNALALSGNKGCKTDDETPRVPAMSLPVQETKSGWCIRGVYEHQGLRMGLRQLNTRPEALHEPSTTRRRSFFLKEKLMMELAEGKIDLQKVHKNDLNAAQGDVQKLSVRQLLAIAVKYDAQMKGAQGEFMMAVENALYEKLGHCATATANLSCACEDVDDVRRLGREAVLLVAAAAAIPCSPSWSWWIMGGRVFFDTKTFACLEAFPEAGVVEFSDYSKVERFAGRSMDWQIRLVQHESDLRTFAEHQRRRSSVAEVSLEAITQCRASLRKTSEFSPHQIEILKTQQLIC
mmetsp:Transcript_102632/g.162156  ORF Transcript_102632/g.162156 Transcript_102632/m.162156 type:complete len:466 (+) Transcript_102632:44-1441(+)